MMKGFLILCNQINHNIVLSKEGYVKDDKIIDFFGTTRADFSA